MFGVNYFFRSTTIIIPDQRQLLLELFGRRVAPPPRAGGEARPYLGFFFFLRERKKAVGKWETCFWFSTFPSASPPELWKCGNLARSWRDFQGARGKRGKPAFGFPRFPQPRHFHSSLRVFISPPASLAPPPIHSPRPAVPSVVSSWPPPLESSECSAR
jgi:hypothetical protein